MEEEHDGYAPFFRRLNEAIQQTNAVSAAFLPGKARLVDQALEVIHAIMWPGPGVPDSYWRESDEAAIARPLSGLTPDEFDKIAPCLRRVLEVYGIQRSVRQLA